MSEVVTKIKSGVAGTIMDFFLALLVLIGEISKPKPLDQAKSLSEPSPDHFSKPTV
jgi:hypothetical protein